MAKRKESPRSIRLFNSDWNIVYRAIRETTLRFKPSNHLTAEEIKRLDEIRYKFLPEPEEETLGV